MLTEQARPRLSYLALAAGTIGVGLAVHFHGGPLSPTARDGVGDALWAAMIAWLAGAAAPASRLAARAALALGLCFAVEFGQLYHTPLLDAIRATRVGHLALGSGFDARDLAAYALGIVGAALLGRMAVSVGERRVEPRRMQ